MTIHRFYINPGQVTTTRARILGDDARQITRVLRLRPGAVVECFDGTGQQVTATLTRVSESEVEAAPTRVTYPATELAHPLTLVMALLKGERLDWVIEKATELGVSGIVVFPAARSVARAQEERLERKALRWRRIAKEAAEQSGRVRLPSVEGAATLEEALERVRGCRLIVADEAERGAEAAMPVKPLVEGLVEATAVVVGPEGGWSAEEREAFQAVGAERVSLGPRVLRSETAAVALLARLTG